MITNLEDNHKKMLKKFNEILAGASRNVWRCNPEPYNYKEGLNLNY